MSNFEKWLKTGGALALITPFGLASAVALASDPNPNPNSTTLPNGASLDVEIDTPADSTEFQVPAALGPGGTINVLIDATGSVGQGTPNIHLTFVVDVSGSTSLPCGIDTLTVNDCEKQAVINVTNDANYTSVVDTGVTVFGSAGFTGDMAGAGGPQAITSVVADVQTVMGSIFPGGIGQYTHDTSAGGGTLFSAGLNSAQASVSASSAGTKRVIFLSDGFSAGTLAQLDAALAFYIGSNVKIDTLAVGGGSQCSNPFGPQSLAYIASQTGGQCTHVPNPASLPAFLPNLVATSLDDVQVAVDGGDVTTGNCSPVLPAVGPTSSSCDANPLLGVGDHDIEATADGSDSSGAASVTANSVQIHLLQLTADPATDSNELSVDDAHTVNGQILGGAGPDRNIDFLVSAGPNAGPGGSSLATPGGAAVSFSYTVPVDCASLGTDTITVSTTIAGGSDSVDLTKDWVDTIAPTAACEESANPHGNTTPPAGSTTLPGSKGGQNEDGYYELTFGDNLPTSCLTVEVRDGSGYLYTYVPNSGDLVKYTEDNTIAQEEKKIGSTNLKGKADAVAVHLIGLGDLSMTVTDASGNSATTTCLVPEPPK
jgi:hypothetical protein